MIDTTQAHPPVVDLETWQRSRAELLTLEKVGTRLTDAIAAQRRRLPMTPVDDSLFVGKDGPVTLAELFGSRPQPTLHHFMFHPDWDAGCPSCTHFAENATPHLAHLKSMDASFVRISRAPIGKLLAYAENKGWSVPWYSSFGNTFNQDWGWTGPDGGEGPGLNVYLLLEGRPHLTYSTTGRGVEPMSSHFGYADLLPYGRQERWQAVPPGWPQVWPQPPDVEVNVNRPTSGVLHCPYKVELFVHVDSPSTQVSGHRACFRRLAFWSEAISSPLCIGFLAASKVQVQEGTYEPECREASLSDRGGVHAAVPDSNRLLSGADG